MTFPVDIRFFVEIPRECKDVMKPLRISDP